MISTCKLSENSNKTLTKWHVLVIFIQGKIGKNYLLVEKSPKRRKTLELSGINYGEIVLLRGRAS